MRVAQSFSFRFNKLPGWLGLLILESVALLAVLGWLFSSISQKPAIVNVNGAPPANSNVSQNCNLQNVQAYCAFINQVPAPTIAPPTIVPTTTVAPTTVVPTTTIPTKVPATTLVPISPIVRPAKSAIGGTVFLDGVPVAGFKVRLEPLNNVQTTGPDGKYYFSGLAEGTYVVRVVDYEASKIKATIQDFSNQTVTGESIERRVDFPFVRLAITTTPVVTTLPPTTTVPSTPAFNPGIIVLPDSAPAGALVQIKGTGWNPRAGNAANRVTVVLEDSITKTGSVGAISGLNTANNLPIGTLGTFDVATDGSFVGQATLPAIAPQRLLVVANDLNGQRTTAPFVVEPTAGCPAAASGNGLRLAVRETQRNATDFYLCLQIVAGVDGVDLNDTIIVNLPSGVTVIQSTPGLGTVSVANNSVRWGGFGLSARQSTTLVLSLTTSNGSLQGTSLFVSGRFNQGQSFQQRIPGLPPLTEINAVPVAGQGGAPAPIPAAAPATGFGTSTSDASFSFWPILIIVSGLGLLSFALLLTIRQRRNR